MDTSKSEYILPRNSSTSSSSQEEQVVETKDPISLKNDDNSILFSQIWKDVTSDNRLTLFGFRRYRTTHLLNLRFLEAEIHKVDHELYQIGLQLDSQPGGGLDRLGLQHAKMDKRRMKVEEVVNQDLVLRLRALIKEYDEALAAFNTVMTMETFSLADNFEKASPRKDLHAFEKFKTRLLRVDLPLRKSSRDPIQHYLRKGLRRLWYHFGVYRLRTDDEEQSSRSPSPTVTSSWDRTYQNTARVAEILTRFAIAMVAGASLVVPLALLSSQQSQSIRLVIVAVCITVFSFIIALLSKASNYESMAATAAYAAVLTVFLSNGPTNGSIN